MQWTAYLKIAAFIFDVTSIVIQTKLSRCLMLDPCMMLQIMIIENGAYGKRQVKICETLKIPFTHLQIPENEMACPIKARDALRYIDIHFVKAGDKLGHLLLQPNVKGRNRGQPKCLLKDLSRKLHIITLARFPILNKM